MINDTKRKNKNTAEILLSQWPDFDEKRYLQVDQGKTQEYLVDFFNDNPNSVGLAWLGANTSTRLQAGSVASILDVYRALKISNVRLNSLVDARSFNCFPFTLLKIGKSHTINESAESINVNYDQIVVNQLLAEEMDMQFLLSYGNRFTNINLDNCNLRYCYLERTAFDYFTWENTDFYNCAFGYIGNPDNTEWKNGVVSDVRFVSCALSKINASASVFYRCTFNACTMRSEDDEADKRWGNMFDCNLWYNQGTLRFAWLERCDLTYFQAIYGTQNLVDGIKDCVVELATISHGKIGFNVNSSFRGTTFTDSIALLANASVNGCDFTGTNIHTVSGGWATKTAFKAALDGLGAGRYNADTIWVDGTSVMED